MIFRISCWFSADAEPAPPAFSRAVAVTQRHTVEKPDRAGSGGRGNRACTNGRSGKELFFGGAGGQFGDYVQVSEVPGVLLEQVEQDAFQGGEVGAVPAGARLAHVGQVVGLDDRAASPAGPRAATISPGAVPSTTQMHLSPDVRPACRNGIRT